MTALPEDTYEPESANRGGPHAVLILTAGGTEDLEFFYPYYRFIEAGYTVDVVTPKGGEFKGKQGLGLKATGKISDAEVENYDLLYIPGGKAPSELKKNEEALHLVRQFVAARKPIAAICHGPQILAAAKVIEGRKIAAWPQVENEVNEAGAIYENKETVIDGPFITARWPGDLPAHLRATLGVLSRSGSGAMHEAA